MDMINRFLNRFKKNIPVVEEKKERPRQIFSTNDIELSFVQDQLDSAINRNFQNSINPELKSSMDSKSFKFAMDNIQSIKSSFHGNQVIPEQQMLWYANQTFIGYQLCAMLAQQWLISKCCLMPAEDAVRKGYEITVNDGTDINPEVIDAIRKYDCEYKLTKNLIEFIQFGRIFGIRIAMFKVESDDPEYYFKPFNSDGVIPGSYKGISQIDPYWVSPQLSPESAGDPSSIDFYEPTWWNIAGKLIHRTHLIIYRTEEVADILKPSYIYGGVPIPQKIYERVYAAERTANEAPMLALTKRTDVINIDLAQFLANEPANPASGIGAARRIQKWVADRDNYGIKLLGLEEKMQQFDTSLADLDAVIMTQYQLVSSASNVPATKLLGTSPKGFNATGEYEEANYHEMLESLQCHALDPLIERHHLLLMRSKISPEFNIQPFDVKVVWKPLDAMTAEELAALNKTKAETGQILSTTGAIDGNDERERIIADPMSNYTGIEDKDIEEENQERMLEQTNQQKGINNEEESSTNEE
jgi:phage-related protein (TIGR01555 family)